MKVSLIFHKEAGPSGGVRAVICRVAVGGLKRYQEVPVSQPENNGREYIDDYEP